MELKSGFFNSIEGDRTYNANDLNMVYAGARTNGIIKGLLAEMKVVSNPNLTVDIAPGVAIIEDKWCHNPSAYRLSIEVGGTSARIDGIYLKLDETEREIIPVVIKGTESSAPEKPTPIGNSDVTFLPLAYVTVPAGTTSGVLTIEDSRIFSGINSAPRVVLWENPNPADPFAAQAVTLAESVDDFETICVELRTSQEMIGRAGQFKELSSYRDSDSDYVYFKVFTRDYVSDDTLFSFTNCEATTLQINGVGFGTMVEDQAFAETSIKNNMLIPYRVYGVNRK